MDRLEAFEIFVRVIETGSFSAAARQQNITQPTVSKAVAQLEEWLGVTLLLRSTRSLTPTEAGLGFYERALRAIEETSEGVRVARGAASGLTGRLRVSAAVCFARLHIVPRLAEFLREHPDLEVELVLDDHTIDLVEEGIDIALRMGPLTSSNMAARLLAEAPRVVVATPEYFAKHGMPKVPSDLANHEALIYTRDGDAFTFRKGEDEVVARLHGKVKVNATEGLRAAVFAHMGVAIASGWTFSPELVSGQVAAVLQDWTLPRLGVSAVYPTGRMASGKARAFAGFVEGCLAGVRFG